MVRTRRKRRSSGTIKSKRAPWDVRAVSVGIPDWSDLKQRPKTSQGRIMTPKGDVVNSTRRLEPLSPKISLQSSGVDDHLKSYELGVLKKILQREKVLEDIVALHKLSGRRQETVCALQALAKCSVFVVEAISKWRSCLEDKQAEMVPFIYNGVNYMLKMVDDVNFVSDKKGLVKHVCSALGYDASEFTLIRNPFLGQRALPECFDVPSPRAISDALREPVVLSSGTQDVEQGGHGYIPSLDERRVMAARQLLILEESNFSASKLTCASAKAVQHELGLDRPKTLVERGRERQRKRECDKRAQEEEKQERNERRGQLAPLSEADIRALRGNSRSKLERMEKDCQICAVAIEKLEKAFVDVSKKKEERLARLSKAERQRPDARKRVLKDLVAHSDDISKKLRFRRIELEQKRVAMHCFVKTKIDCINAKINQQLDDELTRLDKPFLLNKKECFAPPPKDLPAIQAARQATINASEAFAKAAAEGNAKELSDALAAAQPFAGMNKVGPADDEKEKKEMVMDRATLRVTRLLARDCVRNVMDVACGHVALKTILALETDLAQWRRVKEQEFRVDFDAAMRALEQEKRDLDNELKSRIAAIEEDKRIKLEREQKAQLERLELEAARSQKELVAKMAQDRLTEQVIHAVATETSTGALMQGTLTHFVSQLRTRPDSRQSVRTTGRTTESQESVGFNGMKSMKRNKKLTAKKLKKRGAVFDDDSRQLPQGWTRVFSRSKQREYFFDQVSGKSVWTLLDVPGALTREELLHLDRMLVEKNAFSPSQWVGHIIQQACSTSSEAKIN